jgi:hypothetical protein
VVKQRKAPADRSDRTSETEDRMTSVRAMLESDRQLPLAASQAFSPVAFIAIRR